MMWWLLATALGQQIDCVSALERDVNCNGVEAEEEYPLVWHTEECPDEADQPEPARRRRRSRRGQL